MTNFFSNQNVIKIFKTTCIGFFAFICAGAGLYFSSCNSNVGLGASVDTEAPKVSIVYPPANKVLCGSFVLAGECSDDKGVASVKVTIAGYTGYEVAPATLHKEDDGMWWEVKIDTVEIDTKEIKIPDGKYAFNAIAVDEIGRESALAERALEIDNHEPVFIIKSPGVTEGKSPSSYGTIFKVTGNIADDHDIKKFHIDIYDFMNSEKLIASWDEFNISVAGGTEVTFAQYDKEVTFAQYDKNEDSPSDPVDLNDRYRSIYTTESGDQSFFCTVTIEDAAEQYMTPKLEGGGGMTFLMMEAKETPLQKYFCMMMSIQSIWARRATTNLLQVILKRFLMEAMLKRHLLQPKMKVVPQQLRARRLNN